MKGLSFSGAKGSSKDSSLHKDAKRCLISLRHKVMREEAVGTTRPEMTAACGVYLYFKFKQLKKRCGCPICAVWEHNEVYPNVGQPVKGDTEGSTWTSTAKLVSGSQTDKLASSKLTASWRFAIAHLGFQRGEHHSLGSHQRK